MTAQTKNLYRTGLFNPWKEGPPKTDSKAAESAKFALIIRRQEEIGETEEPEFPLHSIIVQSPIIKAQLGPVFAGYEGINTNVKKIEFNAPFHEFFHRWDEFVKAKPQDENDQIGRAHYKLLFDIISSEILPYVEQIEDLVHNQVISFDYVWALFKPGTEKEERLYIASSGKYSHRALTLTPCYDIECRYVDTTGESFGYARTSLDILEFKGLKPISELSVLPSALKPNISEIRARLTQRGREFEKLLGVHHKAYTGVYVLINAPSSGVSREQPVNDGRVIVDCSSFRQHDGHSPRLAPLDEPITPHNSIAPVSYDEDSDNDDSDNDYDEDNYTPPARPQRPAHSDEEHYALCSPTVNGFCLKAKDWVELQVENIHDIVWNTNAFDRLVLPHDYKRLVWAFVQAQLSRKDDFDDVIKGKGKGIIMLLSGQPGTGKTLTSESVSEAMKKPLYSISAGELGEMSGEVERKLTRVLELSTKWGAVLLLDECDVFLERRSASNLYRNKLVAVFLRLLEYYQGVMFLTTNRVEDFDHAFESRIHLTIHYPQLDVDSRLLIWRTFVQPDSAKSSFTEDNLKELANTELNGRQIKNVVKTARLLATGEDVPLAIGHVQTVLRVRKGQAAGLGSGVTYGD
ncbi:P-loop containing nucleoside triphosphate hydrolase protein [Phyllosticta citribraziliensis]